MRTMHLMHLLLLTAVYLISDGASKIGYDEGNGSVGIPASENSKESKYYARHKRQSDDTGLAQNNGINGGQNGHIGTLNVFNNFGPGSGPSGSNSPATSGDGSVHLDPCDLDCDRTAPEINQCCKAHKYAGGACYSGQAMCHY